MDVNEKCEEELPPGEGSSWWSSWTSGILENVKEKTSAALEFVQSDLSEFVNTIQHDTSLVIADSATAVNQSIKVDESEKDATSGKLKKGFSDILTSISTSLHESIDKKSQESKIGNNEQCSSVSAITPAVYDRTKAKFLEVQTNPDTYRNEPNDPGYERWCETFDLDSKKGEISELLVNNSDVRRLYTNLVPSEQSHSTFWHRYFYKIHEIQTENKRLADIVARASQNESESWDWDDEDEIATNLETDNICASKDISISEERKHEDITMKDECKNTTDMKNNKDKVVMETTSDVGSTSGKSDSSDSNSWIRISEKEASGVSSNSSSSVVLFNEKEPDNGEDVGHITVDNISNDDDDDDEFDINDDISNEDVEKLVQSITANQLDSGEDDWEDWE